MSSSVQGTGSEKFVRLELSWKGDVHMGHHGWFAKVLDISMKNAVQGIAASINTELLPTIEQQLDFEVSDEKLYSGPTVCRYIDCPVELAKAIKITARIFQIYKDRSCATMMPNGELQFGSRARRDNLPVDIDTLPKFEGGESFRIKVINQDNEVRATFEKKQTNDDTSKEQTVQTIKEKEENIAVDPFE